MRLFCLAAIVLLSSAAARPEKSAADTRIHWNPASPLALGWPYAVRTNGITALVGDSSNAVALEISSVTLTATNSLVHFALPSGGSLPEGEYRFLITNSSWTRILSNNLLVIDTTPPVVKVLAASPGIVRGGSALAVFRALDPNLDSVALSEKSEGKFPVQNDPEISPDAYAGFVVWPVYRETFRAEISATDRAGNRAVLALGIPAENKKYPVKRLAVSTNFSQNKFDELGTVSTNIPTNEIDRYRLAVREMAGRRQINVFEETFRAVPGPADTGGLLKAFDPVPGSRVTSPFGEHRLFYLGKKRVRESYHLGLDLARSTNADILASNPGTVVYSGYNGGFGNMLLLDHGLGVHTLYSHCSELLADKGQKVGAGVIVARTGKTGYALGDHLHFSVVIQGRYANPVEWMDPEWLKISLLDVRKKAKKAAHSEISR